MGISDRNENLKARTKQFALDVIALVDSLPRNRTCDVLGRQLLRSATSVSANYRAACHAKLPADFISKMGTVEEEADESGHWMELLQASGQVPPERLSILLSEANELVAITVASIKTARANAAKNRTTK